MKKYNTCVQCGEKVLADTDNGHEPVLGFFGESEFYCEFCFHGTEVEAKACLVEKELKYA